LCAREYLEDGFVSSYADIVYEGAVVRKMLENPNPIVVGCDTEWRRRYLNRSQHPESDAEKLRADGSRVLEISRRIDSEQAHGEFIGVMKLSAQGARQFLSEFDGAEAMHAGQLYREGRSFERAYLIDLLSEMLERDALMFRENTAGGYMEIDTLEDLRMAETWWRNRPTK
jgi:choline kinase